ncbi:unnamed protein product, partial [Symbiodinium microadriaticum]
EYDASRELRSGKHDNETVTLLYRLANHMEQPWRSKARARLRRVLTFRNATVPKFNLPLKIPFLAHSAFKNNVQKWVSKLIRQHRHVLIPYHLPTKTIQELPHPALNKVLWNHMHKVIAQGRYWEPEPCKCHEFLLEHPRAEQHEGHVATGLETLDFCKGQSNLGAAFANVGACNAFFSSKQRLHDQVLEQLRRWLKHHLFPNDDRILESFEAFFEEQWQQHKEQQRHERRLTHRLIKHLTSALPDNYIIHNEDHANAHLMIYCPNGYNQAAFNTWMDKKTFLLLDKTPEDIKEDMERQKTSPHLNCGKRYVDNRAIIVDKDVLHNNPHIRQLASLHFYKKPVQLEDENCDDFLDFRINANNRQKGKKTHDDVELTDVDSDSDIDLQPVRLPHGLPLDDPPPQLPISSQLDIEQVCRRHLDNGYIPMSVFPWLAQELPSELLRASALTRRGAPAMVFSVGAYFHAGSVGIQSNTTKYPCTSALLAYMVRACTHSNFSAVSLLHNVNMATHVDRYNQPGLEFDPLTKHATCPWKDDRRPGQCHRQDVTNDEYNHSIRVKSMALADAHSLACDMSIQRNVDEAPEIIAYTILEVTFDLRTLVHLAQTNKATWSRGFAAAKFSE